MNNDYIDFDYVIRKTCYELKWILVCIRWRWYATTHLGTIVKVKIFYAQLLAKSGFRKPVNIDIEFPEWEWDTDIYGK
jgi:hypothetical protein